MLVDIHAHTSKHLLFGLHIQKADIYDLEEMAQKYRVTKIYLMATCFPLKHSGVSTTDMLNRIKRNPLFGCFGTLNLENLEGYKELEYHAQRGDIEGIKLYPGYQNVSLSKRVFNPIYKIAHKYNLPVALHMGELHHCCPPKNRDSGELRCGHGRCLLDTRGHLSHPKQLKNIATMYPDIRFLAAHLANPYFEELQKVMMDHPNVYTDISGQFLSGTKEDTPECRTKIIAEIKKFLVIDKTRVLFGTDFPIQSYKDTLEFVEALDLNTSDKELILSKNAEKFLKG